MQAVKVSPAPDGGESANKMPGHPFGLLDPSTLQHAADGWVIAHERHDPNDCVWLSLGQPCYEPIAIHNVTSRAS